MIGNNEIRDELDICERGLDLDRLVDKGNKQKQGVDFDETFPPIAIPKSIHIYLQQLHIMTIRYDNGWQNFIS